MSSIAACLDGTFDADGEAFGAAEIPDEDAEAMVLFTSGSSGEAKGVRLSHRSVIANQHNLLLRARRLPHQQRPDDPQTITLVTVPLFHIGGVTGIVTQVVAGGRLVFLRGRFDPAEVLELIEAEGVTSWGGVPTMAKRVLDHPDFERRDLSSLRSFPLGGAPVPDVLLDRLREKLPHVARGSGQDLRAERVGRLPHPGPGRVTSPTTPGLPAAPTRSWRSGSSSPTTRAPARS